jgi:hypothetical protein
VPSQDLNPCPIVLPNYKLNCVWCTVELKVIGNLECRIKFYREKKPRHFFYTIEYPYPPTNSVCTLFYRIGNGGNKLFVFVFVFVVNGANWPKLQPKKNSSRLNDKKQQKMFTFFRRIGEFYCILWA